MARRRDGRRDEPRRARIRHIRARRREERTAPHSILATMVGAGAGILPFIAGNPYANGSTVIEDLSAAINAAQAGDNEAVGTFLNQAGADYVIGIWDKIIPIIGLGALAAGIGWAGRKYAKSSTNVSRKWRVF
jgi:hypothetical protein